MMCRVLGVSASGYHAWHRRPPSRRGVENQALGTRIAEIHEESGGTYGGRRVHATLRAEGRAVSRQRVERLMRSLGLQGVHRRRPRSTPRADAHAEPVPDRVKRQFEATEPNRLWVADITYVDTQEGFLFLAIVIDVFSRKVVGWAMAARQTADLTRTALEMALETRGAKGVIFHSDHGSQYTAVAFTSRCKPPTPRRRGVPGIPDKGWKGGAWKPRRERPGRVAGSGLEPRPSPATMRQIDEQ